jgi:hypothetical protein
MSLPWPTSCVGSCSPRTLPAGRPGSPARDRTRLAPPRCGQSSTCASPRTWDSGCASPKSPRRWCTRSAAARAASPRPRSSHPHDQGVHALRPRGAQWRPRHCMGDTGRNGRVPTGRHCSGSGGGAGSRYDIGGLLYQAVPAGTAVVWALDPLVVPTRALAGGASRRYRLSAMDLRPRMRCRRRVGCPTWPRG